MRRVSRRHCPAAPAANVRYKSAYFRIPSTRRRTKAALYVPVEARRKDTNTGRQCVPAATDNGHSVMSGWRMKTPTNKGWREAAASVDGINITEEVKLKATLSTGGAVPDWFWPSKMPSSRPLWLVLLGEKPGSSRLDRFKLIQQKKTQFSTCSGENMSDCFYLTGFTSWFRPVQPQILEIILNISNCLGRKDLLVYFYFSV